MEDTELYTARGIVNWYNHLETAFPWEPTMMWTFVCGKSIQDCSQYQHLWRSKRNRYRQRKSWTAICSQQKPPLHPMWSSGCAPAFQSCPEFELYCQDFITTCDLITGCRLLMKSRPDLTGGSSCQWMASFQEELIW